MEPCRAMWGRAVLYGAVSCYAVPCRAVPCSPVPFRAVPSLVDPHSPARSRLPFPIPPPGAAPTPPIPHPFPAPRCGAALCNRSRRRRRRRNAGGGRGSPPFRARCGAVRSRGAGSGAALSGGGSPLPVSVGPMEVADKLRILEDLNMLYIRQIALSLEDTDIQKKIDHEIRMREGACKLLAACTQREQALEATKSLQVCNSRILAYMAELQRMKEAQVMQRAARRPSDAGPTDERLPCRGRVCVSDLRIPLMWKDTEYFRNKGELHRCAVFCLLQLGVEIYDTEMVLVDRTLTDICFENAVLFSEAGPDFLLKVELYSAGLGEEVGGSAPRKLASKLSSSLGRSAGRRLRANMEGGPHSPTANGGGALLLPAPSVPGPKYHLLAHTVLSLAEVQDGFRTHDLAMACSEESSFWLPLYGSMCCRLAAQPHCMAAQVMCGFLKVQPAPGDPQGWARLFCVLRGTNLLCYRRAQEAEGGVQPALTIAINKETRIRATEQEARGKLHSMTVTNRYGAEEVTHTLLPESRGDTQRWMEAFWQHFYDMSQWKQCCDELMRIDAPPPRRPPAPLPRQGSLYHEMALPGPAVPSCEGLLLQDNAVSAEIRALLSSYYSDSY